MSHIVNIQHVVKRFGGFAAVAGIIRLESVLKAIEERFAGKIAAGNIAAAKEAYEIVKVEMEENAHA